MPDVAPETLEGACKRYEHWETPEWAVVEILKCEILTSFVVDPCAGAGVMTRAARRAGYSVQALDIHDWGQRFPHNDWLVPDDAIAQMVRDNTVFMNPPFTKSEAFVERAFCYDARKIVCFQKFSWYEGEKDTGKKRGTFWEMLPPSRIYVCGSRATCWRHDIAPQDRLDSHGREKSTPTTYAWFVWESGHPRGTTIGHIYNPKSGGES
jgi:hypothetical protein